VRPRRQGPALLRGPSTSPLDGSETRVVSSTPQGSDPRPSLLWRMSHSLVGHIALAELLFSAPGFLFFAFQHFEEGTLTLLWAAYLAAVWASFGAAGAALLWYAVSAPLIRARSARVPSNNRWRGP